MVFCRIRIDDKISFTQELEVVACFILFDAGFSLAVIHIEAVRIDLGEEILAVRFFFIVGIGIFEQIVIDPRFDIDSIISIDPVKCPFNLAIGIFAGTGS